MAEKSNIKGMLKLPAKLLAPIKRFLEMEIVKMKKQEKNIKKADPFKVESRVTENSVEEDVDEQLGHFESQIKANFIRKQIVEFRKALTMIKLGRYGICRTCNKMIDTDRLAIKPEATMCVKCEKERES